jgi:serine/threonine protein kinase/Tfp pilus assembly protein PilF
VTGLAERLRASLAQGYLVERELGEGGMATVYLAADLKHGRKVALKVLRPELAAALGVDRFLQEIAVSARLVHPNILPLLDSGEADGLPFYVMPYVAGQSLRELLDRERQLPIDTALGIARDVAAALQYAHDHGIVHRDIKPENILLASGHAIVADFGIARAITQAAPADRLTRTGVSIGTPAYMSPEQAGAEADIDGRSDVYSLGCVLYEMLAGQAPFAGPSVQSILARHQLDPVPPVRTVRSTVPGALEQVVMRALAKVPADRFPTAGAFAEALEAAARAEPERRSPRWLRSTLSAGALAGATALLVWAAASRGAVDAEGASVRLGVLPADIQEHSDSGVEAGRLIQHLLAAEFTGLRGLAVIDPFSLNSRLAASGSRAGADPLHELGEWGLDYAVRVTVAPGANGSDFTITLVNARSGSIVGTTRFTGALESELASQVRRAADRLMRALDVAAGGITKHLDLEPWLARRPARLAALAAFVQGTEYSYRFIPGGREHFERAVRLDSTFIAPRVWLVSALAAARDTASALAHVQVLRSLEARATPFEQAMIGWAAAMAQGDLEAKANHLRVALRHSPRNNVLLFQLGATLHSLGRAREAVLPLREAVASRWQFPRLYALWGLVAVEAGELDGLRQTLEEALDIAPQSPYIPALLEALCLFEGDTANASRYRTALRVQPEAAAVLRDVIPSYRSLAQRARERGGARTAVALLRRVMDVEPGRLVERLELARALAEAGERRAAEGHFRAVAPAMNTTPEILYLAGEVAAGLGWSAEAAGYLRQYLNVVPDGPDAAGARRLLRSLAASPRQ